MVTELNSDVELRYSGSVVVANGTAGALEGAFALAHGITLRVSFHEKKHTHTKKAPVLNSLHLFSNLVLHTP